MFDSNVTFAKFREVNPEDSKYSFPFGNFLWRVGAYPFEIAMKTVCTGKLYLEKNNALNWYKPLPFQLVDKISGWLRISPECTFISYFPTFFGNYYHIEDPVVIKALFKEFRGSINDNGLFKPTRSIRTLFDITKEVFPEDEIAEEDVMFTCSAENSKFYRIWLHHLFDGNHVSQYLKIIHEEAKITLNDWALRCMEGQSISLFETALFASKIITQVMFGKKVGGEDLAKAVNFINWYALHKQIGKVSKQDDDEYKESLTLFKQTIEAVIEDLRTPLFQNQGTNSLTLAQKKAMAFVIFFAGQETTGILLGNILHFLAKNKDLQCTLRKKIEEKGREHQEVKKEIECLINNSLANFPPSYAISRCIGEKDVCLEYKLEGEEGLKKLILRKGDFISARMIDVAKKIKKKSPEIINKSHSYDLWSAFGGGAHSCPGKNLALAETMEFIFTALQGYELATNVNSEPQVIGQITLKFVEDITLTITPLVNIQDVEPSQEF